MKKIFITGSTGFIGTELLPKVINKYDITCLIRKSSDAEKFEELKIKTIIGDILDKEGMLNALKNMEIVVHLASSHQKGNENFNLIGSKNVIEACKKNHIRKLIFVSSMATKRTSLDDYGKTKLEIENLIKQSGLNYIILRPSIIYSKNNLSLIGKSIKAIPFIIPIIGNGEYKLNPVYIQDVVDSIYRSIESKKKNRIYDIAGNESLSFNEIIQICKSHFKIRKINMHIPITLFLFLLKFFPIVSVEVIKGINEDTNADIRLIKQELNINPVGFKEGIKNVNL